MKGPKNVIPLFRGTASTRKASPHRSEIPTKPRKALAVPAFLKGRTKEVFVEMARPLGSLITTYGRCKPAHVSSQNSNVTLQP